MVGRCSVAIPPAVATLLRYKITFRHLLRTQHQSPVFITAGDCTNIVKTRRQIVLKVASTSTIVGLAGCAGNNSSTENAEPDSSDSASAPEYKWQENSPRCSDGDYIFELRGVKIEQSSRTITVSVRNTGVESYQMSSISIVLNDNLDRSPTLFTDAVIEGGGTQSFTLDPDGLLSDDDEVTSVGLSVTALEGDVNDELCWTPD